LWRYSVKSIMGEEISSTRLGEHGPIGDRMYALIDRTIGKIARAKNPRKWPDMLNFSAPLTAAPAGTEIPPMRIKTPDRVDLVSGTDDVDRTLSQVLKREVMLQSQPPEVPSLEQYWPDSELHMIRHKDTASVANSRSLETA
jgi:hypothetical protein